MAQLATARQDDNRLGLLLVGAGAVWLWSRSQGPGPEPPPPPPGVGAAVPSASITTVEAAQHGGGMRLAQRSRLAHARQSNKRVGDSGTIRVSFRYRGPDERLRFDFSLENGDDYSLGGRNINVPASTEFVTRTISHSFTFPDVPAMPAQLWDVRVRVELDGDLLDQDTERDAYWVFVEL
ncbi:MAG: hypothetical protein WD533_06465 [Dehalococcoidia bacterium]